MIRIAFDEQPGQGGPQRYVAALARALQPPDWQVELCDVGSQPGPPAAMDRADQPNVVFPAASRGGVKRIVPHCALQWLGFRREAKRLATEVSRLSVDIFHSQRTGCEEMPVAARWARVPRVLGTFHVDSTYDLKGERSGFTYRSLEWISNRCLHKAIAVSEATKRDWIRRTGIAENRIVTIHNGIDPEHFRRQQPAAVARGRLGLPSESLIIGGIGRLDAAKGFAYLIEALAHLQSDFPRIYVVIAGTGPLRATLEEKAQSLGVSSRVMLLGFQSDVNAVLDACDIFVLPSLCETLGYALLEAMAHELPTVGSTVGGIPEVIVPGETGFLCPPRDGIALAASIRPLLASAELRQRLGEAGRRRVIDRFHVSEMVRKTIAVYRQLLQGTHLSNRGSL